MLAEKSRPREEQRVNTNSAFWVIDPDRLIVKRTGFFGQDRDAWRDCHAGLIATGDFEETCCLAELEEVLMILLQIYFEVPAGKAADFEGMYANAYVPAMKKQRGYLGSNLLRLFPCKTAEEIQAAETELNYQMELMFDGEENRRLWAASEEHAKVWPMALRMAKQVVWRGYDVAGTDRTD